MSSLEQEKPSYFHRNTIIYGLIESDTGRLRYIGKTWVTLRERIYRHIYDKAKPSYRNSWIRAVRARGAEILGIVLEEVAPGGSWQAAEREWIAACRAAGVDLVNSTGGGDGCQDPTPELRLRMRLARLGKTQSPEAIEKQRLKVTGLRRTPEQIERYRAAAKARGGPTPECREKARLANAGRSLSPEHREKISAIMKRRAPTEAQLRAMAINRAKRFDPESVAKMTETRRRQAQDPEVRAEITSHFGVYVEPVLSPAQVAEARRLRGLGWSFQRIAGAVGTNYGTVRRAVLGIGAYAESG